MDASGRSNIRAATPYLIVRGASRAIEFYKQAFGAVERARMLDNDGKVGHAELRLGSATVFVADEHPETEKIVGPQSLGGTSVIIDIDASDVRTLFERAVAAGATPVRQPDLPSSGVQSAKVVDPFGHVWLITRVV